MSVARALLLTLSLALDPEVPGYQVEKKTLTSKALGEERRYLVALPESYSPTGDRRYPVLYALDGTSQGGHLARTAASLARDGVMPEVIVVAIPNVGAGGRERDYTPPGLRQDHERPDSPEGRGEVFLAFLRDELVPRVDADYRTAAPRALAGHSRGGVFVLYSLMAAPSLFDLRFVSSAPLWREEDALVTHLDAFLKDAPALSGRLVLTVGSAETENIRGGGRRAAAVLDKRAPPGLRWRFEETPDAVHGDNAQRSAAPAFRFLYGPPDGTPAR